MRHWQQGVSFLRNRNRRREAVLRKMATMRAAKERKRLESPPPDESPAMNVERYPFLSWAMRDDLSGEVCWMPLVSVRDMTRRVRVVAKHYTPMRIPCQK